MSHVSLRPSPQVLARRMPGGAVLVHLPTSRIFEVNETGALVWELLAEGLSREGALQRLVDEFGVEPGRAAADFDRMLEQFEQEGLLTRL